MIRVIGFGFTYDEFDTLLSGMFIMAAALVTVVVALYAQGHKSKKAIATTVHELLPNSGSPDQKKPLSQQPDLPAGSIRDVVDRMEMRQMEHYDVMLTGTRRHDDEITALTLAIRESRRIAALQVEDTKQETIKQIAATREQVTEDLAENRKVVTKEVSETRRLNRADNAEIMAMIARFHPEASASD